jgi:hypothetical protein
MVQEPTVASPVPEKISRLPLILGLAGLLVILIMTAMLAFYDFHYTALNGDVKAEGGRIYLTNNSDYEWKDVRLLLNTDYKLNTPELLPHTVFSPELSEFKKDDGTRFNSSYTLVDLYITAVTPDKQTVSNIFKFDQ